VTHQRGLAAGSERSSGSCANCVGGRRALLLSVEAFA
jgi:hypothetical protein